MNEPLGNTAARQNVLECAHFVRRFGEHRRRRRQPRHRRARSTACSGRTARKDDDDQDGVRPAAPRRRSVHVPGWPVSTAAGSAKQPIGFVAQDVAPCPDLSVRENLRISAACTGCHAAGWSAASTRCWTSRPPYPCPRPHRLPVGRHAPTPQHRGRDGAFADAAGAGRADRRRRPQSRHAILESVTRFGEEGMPVPCTTHCTEEAERLCDRVGIMDRGPSCRRGHPAQAGGAGG